MTKASETVLARIDEVIGASDPASDPLLSAMSSGRLSRDELRAFASQYFHLVDALPRFVSTVLSVTLDAQTRRSLLNVIVPLDAMRAYEREGKIGRLHNWFYSTVGTGTTEAEARRMAREMIPFLQEDGVTAIIMGST